MIIEFYRFEFKPVSILNLSLVRLIMLHDHNLFVTLTKDQGIERIKEWLFKDDGAGHTGLGTFRENNEIINISNLKEIIDRVKLDGGRVEISPEIRSRITEVLE